MAVYTDVSEGELEAFLKNYAVGDLLSYKGIAEGSENSNYLLHTSTGAYILTLYERRVERADLPFFLGLMDHLAKKGVVCPLPVHRKDGEIIGELAGRAAALITFLEGMWMRRPTAAQCREVGKALASMHLAGADFPLSRPNALQIDGWRKLWDGARHAPTRSSRGWWPRWIGILPNWSATGRRIFRPASSMPTSSRTMCSSSATGCRG